VGPPSPASFAGRAMLRYGAAMTDAALHRMTLAEFLEWDDGTDTRFELIDGQPCAMAPSIEAHGTIIANLAAAIRPALKPPCRVVVEAGVVPVYRADTWYHADLVVTCTPAERGLRMVREPRLVVEVLSPSTAAHDRGLKLADYRRIASVEQILMVASEDRHVEAWRRSADGWTVHDLIGEATLALAITGRPLPLAAIYEGVAL
jgi:Uma2 family endonuclease